MENAKEWIDEKKQYIESMAELLDLDIEFWSLVRVKCWL